MDASVVGLGNPAPVSKRKRMNHEGHEGPRRRSNSGWISFVELVSFVVHAFARSRYWQGIPGLWPPRLCKQLHRFLQLPLKA